MLFPSKNPARRSSGIQSEILIALVVVMITLLAVVLCVQ